MIQGFCSSIEMGQLEIHSLMQLLAAISTFVRGTAKVSDVEQPCQRGSNHFPSVLFHSTVKQVMLFTELLFIYHFTQQDRPIQFLSFFFLCTVHFVPPGG